MIQRAGKRARRMTSQSVLRSMGQETWRTILCQRPNHSFPIQQCGRHLRVRNPPILQKSKRTYHSPGGAGILWLPLWTFHSFKHFFRGPPLSQSGSNEGSFGTRQYHHMRYRHQASYCFLLARKTLKVWTQCFPAVILGGPHHCPRYTTIRTSQHSHRRPLLPVVCLSLDGLHSRNRGRSQLPNLEHTSVVPKTWISQTCQGRQEPDCWGLSVLEASEAQDTDNDSLLLLRQLLLCHISSLVLLGTPRGSQAVLDQPQRQPMFHYLADPSRQGMVQGYAWASP